MSLKTVRQKIGKGQGFDSPALNENEMTLRQSKHDPKTARINIHIQDKSLNQLEQLEQKTLGAKGRSRSDLKYGQSQKSLQKCFITTESSAIEEKRRSMGSLAIQPFLKELKRQQNDEKIPKMLPLKELIRGTSEA